MSAKSLHEERKAEVRRFVRANFGLRGSLLLHRRALGLDLLRAPLNVLLAPVFLLVRLIAGLARLLRLKRLRGWLLRRRILFETEVARRVGERTRAFIDDLNARGMGVTAAPETIDRAVDDYAGVRNAVAEITTSLLVLVTGFWLFHAATPGVFSLAGPVAELRAQANAVDTFWLGQGLGRLYYGVFPTTLGPWQVMLTALTLSCLAALVTTFAGVLADPVQMLTGTHRRRLMRLLSRLDDAGAQTGGIEREHVTARIGDLADLAWSVWRTIRG